MIFPWRRRVKTYPVPEKYAAMWVTIAKGIEDAQGWAMAAYKAKDEGKVRIYGKMVSDRVSAISNLQRIIFPDLLEFLSKERGRAAVHTTIQIDPPAMMVYDDDAEFYLDAKKSTQEMERDGEGVQTYLHTSLNKPITPVNPEGAD